MRFYLPMLCLLAGCQRAAPPPRAAAPAVAQSYCTRTLGTPECYATPGHGDPLGDTPVRPAVAPPPWWKRIANDWTNQ